MSDLVERLRAVDHSSVEDVFMQSPLLETAADEIDRLTAENERLKTAGICEVAASNPSVMDWIRHWEDRTLKAENELDAIRKALQDWCVLDPPDGGDVKTIEGVHRLIDHNTTLTARVAELETALRDAVALMENDYNRLTPDAQSRLAKWEAALTQSTKGGE